MTYRYNAALCQRFLDDPTYQAAVLSWARGHTLREWARSVIWAVADPVWDD